MSFAAAFLPRDAASAATAERSAAWRTSFDRWHGGLALTSLALLLGWALTRPAGTTLPDGAAWLLVGGALVGIPHGSSDFVVAARWLRPRFGSAWLPFFVMGYLGVVAAVVAGWSVAPGIGLSTFLVASALHFGAADTASGPRDLLDFLARSLTPVLPIFMFHPGQVGPILAALGGFDDGKTVMALDHLRAVAFWPWLVIVTITVIRMAGRRGGPFLHGRSDAWELAALALAAWLLPPFTTFAVYFCGLHAVRHMANLSADRHPLRPRQAMRLALLIVVPSAMVCGAVLALCWNVVAGLWATPDVLCGALKLIAALTVPHMMLEVLGDRARRSI